MKFCNQFIVLAILIYYTIRLTLCTAVNSKPLFPVVTTESAMWEYLNPDNTTIIGRISNMQLTMVCIAPYPIKWTAQGYMGAGDFFRAGVPRTALTSEGKISYVLEGWSVFNIPTTAKATCAHFNDTSLASSVHIIVDDIDSGRLIFQNFSSVGKQILIPCLTTEPNSSVELFKENDGVFEKFENATYEPTLGFTLNEPQIGNFKCRGSFNEVNILIKDAYEILPFEQDQIWLTDEILSIKCNQNGEIDTKVLTNYENSTTSDDESKSIIVYQNSLNRTTFNCSNSQGVVRSVLHYSVADASTMRLNQDTGEIECHSSAKNKSVSFVRCLNPNDCQLMKGCFEDEVCQSKTYQYHTLTGDDLCIIDDDYDNPHPCIGIQTAFFNGLVECAVANKTLNRIFQFFTGLRLIRYENWKDAPTDHLVRMDETPSLVYANDSTTFYCEAVKFLFADSFHFRVTFSNGSEAQLIEKMDYENVDEKIIRSRKVADFNIAWGIKIFLPVDAIRLTCYLFLITEPINVAATRNFTVKYLEKPLIDKKKTNVELTRGAAGQLTCKSSGNPTPEIKWTRNNADIPGDLNFRTKITNDGEAILQFNNTMTISDEGEYVCTSSNRVGNDTATFQVNIIEPRETTLYWIIFGTLAVILLLAIVALYFWRQHSIALNVLRQLTDEEIDEFLNGNRDMWLLNIQNQQESIDYMPYNKQYEIPVEQISFDQSSLLGSGAFGQVVTAKVDDTIVAVKSTKPAADVLYFKSLLSELKIMIFIGHHDYIVKFVGSNTERIKDRKIFIIFELCPLGSLEAYLHKSRFSEPGEEKLINYESSKQLVTLESIMRWSYQIAHAMEYLTRKNVVHADLATRNILLTENQVAKLSDFGLSLKLYTDNNYAKNQQTLLPYRWMAIESLKHLKFSAETDIWSYGITIWEIFSFGEKPYPQENWNNQFVDKLVGGMRLEKPKHCPEEVYDFVMKGCWNDVPSQRPKFSVLVDFFNRHINNAISDSKEMSQGEMKENRSSKLDLQRTMTLYTHLSIADTNNPTNGANT